MVYNNLIHRNMNCKMVSILSAKMFWIAFIHGEIRQAGAWMQWSKSVGDD